MNGVEVMADLARGVIWFGGYAQLLGMPVAWLRLRRTAAWRERPEEVRRIDLLAGFVLAPTVLTIGWGWLTILVAALGGFGLPGPALFAIAFGAPTLFVPWMVAQLDLGSLPRLVERAQEGRARREAKRRGRGAQPDG